MTSSPKWPPDATAQHFAKHLAVLVTQQSDTLRSGIISRPKEAECNAQLEKSETRYSQRLFNLHANALLNPALKRCGLHIFMGNKTPKKYMQDFFNLTRANMKLLYDESNFMGGWSDANKMKELKFFKTHIIAVYRYKNDECSNSNDKEQLVGFASFRFATLGKQKARIRAIYLYELQMAETGKGWGRWLLRFVAAIGAWCRVAKIVCTVQDNNVRALDFYTKKCNFVRDGDENDASVQYSILSCDIDKLNDTNFIGNI